MDDIAYIHVCSLDANVLPKIANVDVRLLHQQHTTQFRSLAQLVDYVDQYVERFNTDVKAASTAFATVSQVQDLANQQTQLATVVTILTDKVNDMDSKLDLLLYVLLPGDGHDAKKGEKYIKDDKSKGGDGHKEKKTSDVDGQSTHVSPSGQTSMVGTSTLVPDDSGTDKETMDDVIIDNAEGAAKHYQALEIKGNIHRVYYQDPRLQLVDEIDARQLLESEFLGEDIEEILKAQRLYLEGDKTEKLRSERGTTRRGR